MEYKRLTSAVAQLEKIQGILDKAIYTEQQNKVPCEDCRFNDDGCSFNYPEFGTLEAIDCSLFESRLAAAAS